ncbi:hypothetical protein R3P38DRAFT_2939912 [Favolaschia claudopus]|uniref:BTB domain-containing protein n=1 Tax=Favolaschia claudopus TaxID=2862362 RepID=A0AAW0BN61_9AGAR
MHAAKRPRTDDSPSLNITRSDIWFDDGNIIVQAETTQFRLYKGALCASSAILKEAVENLGESKGVEGCPILFLSDSSEDLGCLLHVMFYPWSYPADEPIHFSVLAAFLRLGRKYEIKPLYEKALARFTAVFPSSVDDYLNADLKNKLVRRDPDTSRRGEVAVDAIVLGRELGIVSVLPAAFWCASMYPQYLATPSTRSLTDDDRDIILRTTTPLQVAYSTYLFDWLDEAVVPSPSCTQGPSCTQAKTQLSLKLWKPNNSMWRLRWLPWCVEGLCRSCAALGKKHHHEGVERLWKELPSFFNLPEWEEILALC